MLCESKGGGGGRTPRTPPLNLPLDTVLVRAFRDVELTLKKKHVNCKIHY